MSASVTKRSKFASKNIREKKLNSVLLSKEVGGGGGNAQVLSLTENLKIPNLLFNSKTNFSFNATFLVCLSIHKNENHKSSEK